MTRSVRKTIKYFTICGLLILLTLGIRPFLALWDHRVMKLPFWLWEIEYPICTLINIGITIFWGYQTYQRIIQKTQRRMFCAISYCMASWLALSLAQYTFFSRDDFLIRTFQRYLWYLYYVPWMMIPLLFLLIALYIGKSDREKIHRGWLFLWIPYALINLGIVTNDLHQQAFCFTNGFDNWRTSYTHGWVFFLAYFWIFLISVIGVVVIFHRTEIVAVRKLCLSPLATLAFGQILTLAAYRNLYNLHIAEVCILAFGCTLELCIRTSLIPNNVHYPDLIQSPEFQVYIYDREGHPVIKPLDGEDLPKKETPYLLDDAHRVKSASVFGGYVSWIEDESAVHRLRSELQEVQELLKEETSLIREENELNKRKISVQIKRRLYDSISAFSTLLVSQMEQELNTLSLEEHPKHLAHLCIRMAYLKRRSNMVLMEQEIGTIPCEELYNAVYEPFSFLSYLDIYASPTGKLTGAMKGSKILALYDCFYESFMAVYQRICAVLVNFSENIPAQTISLHMMMNLKESLTNGKKQELQDLIASIDQNYKEVHVTISFEDEEDTVYILFVLSKGGEIA